MIDASMKLSMPVPAILALVAAVSALPVTTNASIREVGPTHTYAVPSEAAAVAQDGDTISIDAGTYVGDVCRWWANHLLIRGVNGYAHLEADGNNVEGKGIWVIKGDSTTVEWVEFSGATVPDQNGAGIRQEGTGLTVRHCYFHDNEDGTGQSGRELASGIYFCRLTVGPHAQRRKLMLLR